MAKRLLLVSGGSAHVRNFDLDYYHSDRKNLKIDALTIVATGDKSSLARATKEAQVICESQNFTQMFVLSP
jgi:hypothetical protein